MRLALMSLLFLPLAAGSAFAQPAAADSPEALSAVYACAQVADSAERLSCFDAAVARLRSAETTGEIVAVDRARVEAVEREGFGFSLPSLPRLWGGRDDDDDGPAVVQEREAIAEQSFEIGRIAPRQNGRNAFIMTNDQIWVQTEAQPVRHVRVGGRVTIRRASLGSFLMSVESGGSPLRVRREQ